MTTTERQAARQAADNRPKTTPPRKPRPDDGKCSECGGSGKLTRLGGDWGRRPDTEVACWKCSGTGR